jgi:hypothetical protein
MIDRKRKIERGEIVKGKVDFKNIKKSDGYLNP